MVQKMSRMLPKKFERRWEAAEILEFDGKT